jgi:hypothetical protein
MKTVIELRGGCTRAFGSHVHPPRGNWSAPLEAARRGALGKSHERARCAGLQRRCCG